MPTKPSKSNHGQRPGSPQRPPSSLGMGSQVLFVVLLAAMVGFVQFYRSFRPIPVRQLSYSEFRQLVAQGEVAECVIEAERVRGLLKPKEGKQEAFVAARVEDPDLVKELLRAGVQFRGEGMGRRLWLIFGSWVAPAVLILFLYLLFMRRVAGQGEAAFSFGKSRAKLYMEAETGVTFDDVAGIDEAKAELQEIVEYLRNPGKFQALGGRIPKGVLLVGPPGSGKTLLAKAVAGEAKVPFFSLSASEFVEMFVGVGAARVRDLFRQASQHAPCMVFIDELDALGKVRGISPISSHDEREQTLNQLLVEMDGFDSSQGVIIMAATNRPELLDPALLRPGRFDRQIVVDRPDINGREAILKVHARKVKLAPDVDLRIIAARTPGFVGADLANVVNEAALLAARKNKKAVEMEDFEEAIDRVVAGLEKKSRAMSRQEKEIVAYHEAGHAILAEVLPTPDPVHKISVIPRGVAALGYTLQLPTEDRYLLTEQELKEQMVVMLGGRAAEELAFGQVSTGAQNDLQRATELARRMVKEFGMSEQLGPVAFIEDPRAFWVYGGLAPGREYSEATAQQIDKEVRRLVEEAYTQARQLLEAHREVLDQLAQALLEKEVVEGEELRALLACRQVAKEAEAPSA